MKRLLLFLLANFLITLYVQAQTTVPTNSQQKEIAAVIKAYSTAREKQDTILLKHILTSDVDQLVSTGEWRNGIETAVQGMLKSSITNSGVRTLNIENIRMLYSNCALVDCRYEIQNSDSTARKMWSTFIVVKNKGVWKITAIRNMLPAPQ